MIRTKRPWIVGLLLAAVAPALVLAAIPACPARADTASKALEKYQQDADKAIDKALAYLAAEQRQNGCWSGNASDLRPKNGTAVASLCVMSFLAKGHTPGVGPYGETINRGIDFVLSTQKDNGLLTTGNDANGPMYCHCTSTLMLSEVSGMVDPARQKKIDAALSKAVKVILSAQQMPKGGNDAGGWRYQIDSRDSDISCTGWAVMALRSVRNNGASVPKEVIDRAVAYILRCNNRGDGGFAYQPGGSSGWGRTGTAVLCMELLGHHRERAALLGGEWILADMQRHRRYGQGEYFAYAMYYCSQATFQLGDDYWEKFGERMYELFLPAQQGDGSWPSGGGNEGESVYYPTAMAVLALSVPYRQLPIYQR